MKFYIIQDKTIVNFILAESEEIAEEVTQLKAIEHTHESVIGASKGFRYNSKTKKYESPEVEQINE